MDLVKFECCLRPYYMHLIQGKCSINYSDACHINTTLFCFSKYWLFTIRHKQVMSYCRETGTRHHLEHVARRQRSGRVTVHVWGWMDGRGRGTLHRLPPIFNATNYLQLLQDEFLPAVRRLRETPVHFQQDFSPVHQARVVREWLEEAEDVQLEPWVARAPDLSPIENVWGRMTYHLTPHLRDRRLTADQLWALVQEAWEAAVSPEYCRRLADSVPDRLRETVAAGGHWSGY